jgi:hypothetical protein
MPTNSTIEQHSLGSLERGRRQVSGCARELAEQRLALAEAENARQRFDVVNPQVANTNFTAAYHHWWLIITLAGAYIVDCLLASSVLEDIADQQFDSPVFRNLLRFGFPFFLVSLELWLGNARQRTIQSSYGYRSGRERGLLLGGIAIALVMPAFVVATQTALYQAAENPGLMYHVMLAARLYGMAVLSLILHLFLFFNAAEAMEAKAFAVASVRRRGLTSREAGVRRRVRDAEARLMEDYSQYENARLAHNAGLPNMRREPGPFSAQTIRLVNEVLNEGNPPQAGVQAGIPAAPTPVPPAGPAPRPMPVPAVAPPLPREDEVTL